MRTILILLACTAGHKPDAHTPDEHTTMSNDASSPPSRDGSEPPQADCAPFTLEGRYTLVSYPGMNAVSPDGTPAIGMAKDYAFTESSYTMSGYPPLEVSGDYTVLTVEGNRMHVRFTNTLFDGTPSDDHDLWLTFSDCGDTLEMDGMTYAREP